MQMAAAEAPPKVKIEIEIAKKKAEKIEEEEEEEVEAEEEVESQPKQRSDEDLLERLNTMGVCPQNFMWHTGPPWMSGHTEDAGCTPHPCDHCGAAVDTGFQCNGQGHFVCKACVESIYD